jgi:hypothetical protein
VSLVGINMQAVMDSVLVLFHIVNAIVYGLFSLSLSLFCGCEADSSAEPTKRMFFAVTFVQFVLCTLFEIRYVLMLTQVRFLSFSPSLTLCLSSSPSLSLSLLL